VPFTDGVTRTLPVICLLAAIIALAFFAARRWKRISLAELERFARCLREQRGEIVWVFIESRNVSVNGIPASSTKTVVLGLADGQIARLVGAGHLADPVVRALGGELPHATFGWSQAGSLRVAP
jgi:hypothetical protein